MKVKLNQPYKLLLKKALNVFEALFHRSLSCDRLLVWPWKLYAYWLHLRQLTRNCLETHQDLESPSNMIILPNWEIIDRIKTE